MPRRRRASYAWALHVSADALVGEAREGLSYARLLAENNLRWSHLAPKKGPKPSPLTVEELASTTAVSATTVRRRIDDARFALYGSLSDSGIYYRRSQERKRRERGARTCRAPDCENALPERAPLSRRYCGGTCRRRHNYQRPKLAAEAQAAIVEWDRAELEGRIGEVRHLYGKACPGSSAALHDLSERARLASTSRGFVSLAARGADGNLCAFAYGWSLEQSQWWVYPPLARALRRARKPHALLRDAFVIGEPAVAPEVRGRGLGRALLERLLERPHAKQVPAVLIVVDGSAGQTAVFYRTLGFADLLTECRFSPEGQAKRVMVLAQDVALTAPRARAAGPTRSSRAS